MKKWETISKLKAPGREGKSEKLKVDKLIRLLLENRGVKTKKEIEEFLNPRLENVNINSVGINRTNLKRAVKRIIKAIKEGEQIIVFGDYDVDGICGTAILWETLNNLGAKVLSYIPHRINEGYGLSIRGIENLKSQIINPKLIVTVDNGIVAREAVDFANKQGIDVIITDHHSPPASGLKKLPNALAIVHTTKLCGTGVAYLLSQEFKIKNLKLKIKQDGHLELVALATIADLVPLTGENRVFVKFGIESLRKTDRIGLLAIIKESVIDQKLIDTYQIGHIIAPRLNAMGRIEYAMESLRLLCTKDTNRARALAEKLGSTNRKRQEMTIEAFEHAKSTINNQQLAINNLIFIAHESYEQGVIGLVAGKLVEEFYRPSIVVSKGKIYSKASARSVRGFNIIEFIRSASEFLVDVGGHPMAAGFTVETIKLPLLQEKLERLAGKLLDEDKLKRSLRIDCEILTSFIGEKLYDSIQKLAPFGMGNPAPTFLTRKVVVQDLRLVGENGKHLKLKAGGFDAIAFNAGEKAQDLHIGDAIDIVYTIERDEWNGNKRLQLKLKDFKNSET